MKSLAVIFLCFAFREVTFAFPEMVTHGYVNCTACHVSPTGGSLMTPYGRGLSKELLSMSAREGEEGLLNSSVTTPEWLLAGGDVRAIQTYLNTSQTKSGEFFLMQAELAAALKFTKWTVASILGIKGGPDDFKQRNDLISRNHYVMLQADETLSFRAGKFLPAFGINEPNHTISTRDNLGFGELSETYNIEAAYLGDRWDAFFTAITGRPDNKNLKRESGAAWSSSFNFSEKNKLGFSVYKGKNGNSDRWLGGLWGILSLTKKIFLLSEFDHQWQTSLDTNEYSTRGMVSYNRLGYEIIQGLQLYGTHQLSYLDFAQLNSRTDAYGAGLSFYPRPHFEIRGEWLRERMLSQGPERFDFAWLMMHYYF